MVELLPGDIESLKACLEAEEQKLQEFNEEEARRRRARFLARKRGQAGAAAVAAVPTPQSALTPLVAAVPVAPPSPPPPPPPVECLSPGGTQRQWATAAEAEASRVELQDRLQGLLAELRADSDWPLAEGTSEPDSDRAPPLTRESSRAVELAAAAAAALAEEVGAPASPSRPSPLRRPTLTMAISGRCATPSVSPKKKVCIPRDCVEVLSDASDVEEEERRLDTEIQSLEALAQKLQVSQVSSTASSQGPAYSQDKDTGKGEVKGKGKGKGKPAPPPKAKAKANGLAAAGACLTGASASDLGSEPPRKTTNVNVLRWNVSAGPEAIEVDDRLLHRLAAAIEPRSTSPTVSTVSFPSLPATVFVPQPGDVVAEPPRAVLEHYFTKRSDDKSSWKRSEPVKEDAWRRSMLDKQVQQLADILITKHTMDHAKRTKETLTSQQAIMGIRRALLSCDFTVAPVECLIGIRRVLIEHEKGGRKVCEFVRVRGEAALAEVEHAELHQFVWQLSKIPQISERLECMLFQITFQDNLTTCQQNLSTLRKMLDMLNARRHRIQHFFLVAHKLGQALNRGQGVQHQAQEGFQLSALEMLAKTKSRTCQRYSVLHFVVALVSKRDPAPLFDAGDLDLLRSAKLLRTSKVFQNCIDLVQGMYGSGDVCDSGNFTSPETGHAVRIHRRRRSLPAGLESSLEPSGSDHLEPALDTDDRFFDEVKTFVADNLAISENVAEEAFKIMLMYKELAVYFGDLANVYPPPTSDLDPKKDLCEIFCNFAEELRRIRDDASMNDLRGQIARMSNC